MNRLTGEVEVELGGRQCTLRYDWAALAAAQEAYGDAPDLTRPEVVAGLGALGLRRCNPEWTAARIMEASPPLWPFVQAIQTAYQWAYMGPEAVPAAGADAKKNDGTAPGGWLSRMRPRWMGALAQTSSGG